MEQEVKDKAPKPKGLMPKNLQAVVIAGIAFLMIVIMALTGHKRPKMPQAVPPPAPTAAPVDQQKIASLQKDIQQEQVDSAPQVEAALLQQQRALAAQRELQNPYGTPVTGASPSGTYPPGAYAAASQPGTAPDPVKEDAKKRRYMSLFADNVALSYRNGAPGMQPAEAGAAASPEPATGAAAPGASNAFQSQQQLLDQEGAQLQQEEQMLEQAQAQGLVPKTRLPHPLPPRGRAGKTDASAQPGQEQAGNADPPNPYVAKPGAFNGATGKKYVVFEGSVIQALLVNRLEGSFAGPVTCMVTHNLYSHDRQHLLIPAGSKIFGEARKVDTFGQARLAVVFHRLLMPDGYSVNLDQFAGLGQQGATALKDKVNNHYAKIFGASLAVGVLGGAAELGTGGVLTAGGGDLIRQGFGIGMANSGEQIMNRFLNQMPTVTIREGTRVKVYLSNDLLLPDYNQHKMQANL
ncbi:MAG: TrbI/VirB10 family protein [Terriglobia bacterium]